MSEDVNILTAQRNGLLTIINRCGTEPNTPMDSSTYEYIQSVVKPLVDDRKKLRHIVAVEASKVLEELVGAPKEGLFEQVCEARERLDAAITQINKMHV